MSIRSVLVVCLATVGSLAARAAEKPPDMAPGQKEPILRVEAGGPTSFVRALAVSPDGQTIYAGGYDKVVRVYKLVGGKFALDTAAYRVPVGPGLDGVINAIAVSPDGTWLAAAGMGVVRELAGYRRPGLVVFREGRMTPEMWRDQGTVWLFNTRTQTVRPLRGHLGPVVALGFAPARPGKPALLVSAAQEWDARGRKFVGGVRVWDAARPQAQDPQVKHLTDLPLPDYHTAPGLAAWHTGEKATDLHVAIAWGDGSLRLWDLTADGEAAVRKLADGKFNITAAYLPDSGQVVTASYGGDGQPDGRVRRWDVGQEPQAAGAAAFPPDGETHFFPRALTLLPAKADGPLDHAALVLRAGATDSEYRLALVDLTGKQPQAREFQAPLGKNWDGLPVIAAAPGGRYVAVAGNRDHEVLVFAIADLLRGQARPQKLRSDGARMGSVAFVRKGNSLGLLVTEGAKRRRGALPEEPSEADLVFDFSHRKLTEDTRGWKIDRPEAGDWRVSLAGDQETEAPSLVVRKGEDVVRRISLKPHYVVTDYALLPPIKPLNVPVLAVAYLDDKVQPWLSLYQAETGAQFRQLTGHTDPIRALAFSGDGRLLASAAEDQTVSVWSMTSVGKTLGVRGMLSGVAVRAGDGGVTVSHVDQDSPSREQIKRNDVIEGFVQDRRLRAARLPRDFYDELSQRRPGAEITLRVRGRGDVALRLGQAVDERKPLLSLFITRAEHARDREWLGWSPIGPYDASERKAERLIGWHLNTSDPTRPTAFALADQYRHELHRQGILKHLVAKADVGEALKAWEAEDRQKPLPEPRANLWIDPLGPDARPDGRGQLLLQRQPASLKLRVDDFPLDKIESVTWEVPGFIQRQTFDEPAGQEWSADLGGLRWVRGQVYRVRALVLTREERPREHVRELTVRYQPPPPVIVRAGAPMAGGMQRQVVRGSADFTFRAEVRPGQPAEAVRVALTQSHPRLNQPKRWDERATVERQLKLLPGENLVELVAVNRDALAGSEEWETHRLTLSIAYEPDETRSASPRIELEKVATAGPEPRELAVEPGRPVVVDTPTVRVTGRIAADGPLATARWHKESALEEDALAGFEAGTTAFRINQELPLRAGVQAFRFTARSEGGSEGETRLTLDYRPRLPTLTLQRPAPEVELFDEGQPQPPVHTEWLVVASSGEPYDAVVLVNDREAGHPTLTTDQLLAADVPLAGPGENRIQVRLTNRWKATTWSDAVVVRLLRPPQVSFSGAGPVKTDRALTDLEFAIASALPVPRSSWRATVDGRSLASAHWLDDKRLRLRDVPLQAGQPNEVRVWVSNADGVCRKPAVVAVTYTPPPRRVAAPEVEILDPRETALAEPEVTVRGLVRSTAALRKVELIREGEGIYRKSLDLARLTPNAQGLVRFEERVPLTPRANRIRVEAVNEGGAGEAVVVVTYLYTPVRIAVDRLRPKGAPGELRPQLLPDGKLLLPAAPGGRVVLDGHVMADRADADKLRKVSRVRLFVNGFQQVVRLEAPTADGRERAFRAELLLNQAVNQVEMELADLKQEAGNRREFALVCRDPVPAQRLHYLIIGVGEKDTATLRKEAMTAIGAKADAAGEYHTPAFREIRLYGPLTGFVRPEKIFTQLLRIQQTIDLLARTGSANDVVLLYYDGLEAVRPEGHFFTTSVTRFDPVLQRSGVTYAGLENCLVDMLGAKIVWLDVGRDRPASGAADEDQDQIRKRDPSTHAAVWRAARGLGGPSSLAGRWLLRALDEEMPRGRRLEDVAGGVEDIFRRQFPRGLEYLRRDPASYRDLVVGPGS